MKETQYILHYFLHFGFPAFVAYFFYRKNWKNVLLLFWSTMMIDIDHLWAYPVYDSCRCSIGFHTFHKMPIIFLYPLLAYYKNTRIIGLGLIWHIITDSIDCLFITENCN